MSEPIECRVINIYFHGSVYAEEVPADGPWHARFLFCGKYGVPPDKVRVTPEIRMRNGLYWCEYGETPKGEYSPYLISDMDNFGHSNCRIS